MKKVLKDIYDLVSKELLRLDIEEIGKEIDDLLGSISNYSIHIGNYQALHGFSEDYTLDDEEKKSLMDFDGKGLLDYLLDYYRKMEYDTTVKLIIAYYDEDGNYNEYSDYNEFYIEYNGYELFYDYV